VSGKLSFRAENTAPKPWPERTTAKYGLVTELVGPGRLVAANGWLEVSVVCAVLLGTVLGGALVSPWMLDRSPAGAGQWLASLGIPGAGVLNDSLLVLLAVYAVAALLNMRVPDSGVRYAASRVHPILLAREFLQANRTLWRDRDGGLSLAVTTIFWGVGATLQFAVLRWARETMHLTLDRAAFVQAAVAIGVIAGAVAAGRFVPLVHAKRMLWAGVLFGLLMTVLPFLTQLRVAVAVLIVVGGVGGLMVVPLNALLQERGNALLSAGRSIAVQGGNENASVLVCLGAYSALYAMDVSLVALMIGLGAGVSAALAWLLLQERVRDRRAPVHTDEWRAEAKA